MKYTELRKSMVVFLIPIEGLRLQRSIPLSVIDPNPTYPFDLHYRMDRHHTHAREDHFPTEQLQPRSNFTSSNYLISNIIIREKNEENIYSYDTRI